jgi:hypothetical protein
MSGVFARFHEPTGLEFYDNAVEIEKAVWRFVKNEKNIPKRAWFSHGLPLYKLARQLLVTITRANSVYPIREQELETRRALQLEAIGIQEHLDSHGILREMDKLFYTLFGVFPVHKKKGKKRKEHHR